ncbi:uncharacterized protein BDV14DRAFT_163737 [Aspergillus stella-maris]|uniref:uncharacterized protein n=1 Tax=Aspergillus stella-maris TaxID=1810926 RepID=UPI003CCD7A7C
MLPGANQKPLPPSLSTRSTEKAAAAQVVYSLEVVVERPEKLQKNITLHKVLNFVPSYSSAILRSLHPSVRSAQAVLYATNVTSTLNVQNIPILILEARLQSSVFHIGQRKPLLRLCVRVLPRWTNQPSSVVLNILKINLHTLINISAVGQKRLWRSTLRLVDLVGMNQVFARPSDTDSLSELHHNALNHLMLPSIDPSFSTATFEQRHLLEVEAEFSLSTGKRKGLKMEINVQIIPNSSDMIESQPIVSNGDEAFDERTPLLGRGGENVSYLEAFGGESHDSPPPYLPPYTNAISVGTGWE